MLPCPSTTAENILVVAPPTVYRQGLLTILQEAWPALTLHVTAAAEQLPVLLRQQGFALVVLDSDAVGPALPGLLTQLRGIRSQQAVVVLTAQPYGASYHRELLRSGTPLLPRHSSPQDLVRAVRPWISGETGGAQLPCQVLAATQRPSGPHTPFSRRELEVLRLVVADCNNQEIAEQLCLSVRTVESHRRAMLQKAGARTLLGLVVQAVREGWLPE